MEKDKPRGIELEQELEALYKEVAGQDYPEDMQTREKGMSAHAMAPEVPTLHDAPEEPPPERRIHYQFRRKDLSPEDQLSDRRGSVF